MQLCYGACTVNRFRTIGEISRILGIPVPTLRSWERRYGVPGPRRTGGGHRRYTERDLRALRAMRDAIASGLSARQAAEVAVDAMDSAPGPYAELIFDAVERLEPGNIRAALDAAREALGAERAIATIALPVMREVGWRWATGRCDVAQEHLTSEALRAWLAAVRASAPPPKGPLVLLACPQGEHHTIGIEAFATVLALRGIDARLLGASTPTEAIAAALARMRPRAVVIACQRRVGRRHAIEALRMVASQRSAVPFYAGAAFSNPAARRGVPGIHLGGDLSTAADVLQHQLGNTG